MENPPKPNQETNRPNASANEEKATHIVRQLDWDFWANSAWAVLGLVWATFCVTPIFDFFSRCWKIASVVLGFCLAVAVVVVFVVRSRRLHQQGRTSAQLERQAEEQQQQLRDKINHLESELAEAKLRLKEYEPRCLSPSQRESIIRAVEKFRGQKFSVVAHMCDGEGLSFAYGFLDTLSKAGWDGRDRGVGRGHFSAANFNNARVAVNEEDLGTNPTMRAAGALADCLHTLKISDESEIITDPAAEVRRGEVSLYIAPRVPSRKS